MSKIQVANVTYQYEGSIEPVFKNVSFTIDSNWKLGLIGRNGAGKTTFLNLLLGRKEYKGSITKNIECRYFPYEIENKEQITKKMIERLVPEIEEWKMQKELRLLGLEESILERNFSTLSGGEQIKVMLASLFAKEEVFLLLDEPTNHLDQESKKIIQNYLTRKKCFILVSHDRDLLDHVVDHILSINRNNIEITKGNFSVWKENRDRKEQEELVRNEVLKKDIARLEVASKNTVGWADKIEKTKKGTRNSGLRPDRGYIGHQSAKMMKKAKAIENRYQKEIEEKSSLLQDMERKEALIMKPLDYTKNKLAMIYQLGIQYGERIVFKNISFDIEKGDRIAIVGKNGSGKSSILKLLLGDKISYTGVCKIESDVKISYVSQNTDYLKGTLRELVRENGISEGIFKAMLSKLGISSMEFEKDISYYSEGQKKKVLLAKSICESKNLYIWDEPFNYIDILSRIQIEEMVLKYRPTMLFVEHDEAFIKQIATKKVIL